METVQQLIDRLELCRMYDISLQVLMVIPLSYETRKSIMLENQKLYDELVDKELINSFFELTDKGYEVAAAYKELMDMETLSNEAARKITDVFVKDLKKLIPTTDSHTYYPFSRYIRRSISFIALQEAATKLSIRGASTERIKQLLVEYIEYLKRESTKENKLKYFSLEGFLKYCVSLQQIHNNADTYDLL